MDQRIQLLSPEVANQIAAGEVVERPASVVKELLENSLDAAASSIEVDVEQGGIKLLRVRDDGYGIIKDDLALALCRHATSKLAELSDLQSLASLGFRGEALASISSIAKLTLTSCAKSSDLAWQVKVEGKDLLPLLAPASHPQGTTVEVRELFFNTPARRKFLRSEKTEYFYIEELFKRIALSHFNIRFTLTHNQKIIYQLREALDEKEQENRVAKICSNHFLKNSIKIDFNHLGLRLWGWLGLPSTSRSQTDQQFFYINKRIIRDRLINHAIRQAYQDLLLEGRYPSYILFLEMDSKELDVNVHPTKHEVRFHQSRLVHDFIISQLRKTLHTLSFTGENADALIHSQPSYLQSMKSLDIPLPFTAKIGQSSKPTLRGMDYSILTIQDSKPRKCDQVKHAASKNYFIFKAIERLHKPYVVAESDQGIAIIQLVNAKKRLLFLELIEHLKHPCWLLQPLLLPIDIAVKEDEMECIEQYSGLFEKLGLGICPAGPQSIVVKKSLSILKNTDIKISVKLILKYLMDSSAKEITESLIDKLIVLLVQHTAIQIDNLSNSELDQLLVDLSMIETNNLYAIPTLLPPAVKWIFLNELNDYFMSEPC